MYFVNRFRFSVLFVTIVSGVSANVIWKENVKDYGQCPFTNAVETGRIKSDELKETSGLVASHKNYGVFYAIQDSQNPDPVYAINQEGDLLGINSDRFITFILIKLEKWFKICVFY